MRIYIVYTISTFVLCSVFLFLSWAAFNPQVGVLLMRDQANWNQGRETQQRPPADWATRRCDVKRRDVFCPIRLTSEPIVGKLAKANGPTKSAEPQPASPPFAYA